MSDYKTLLIMYPSGTQARETDEVPESLLAAVVDCGIIPANVKMFYLEEVPTDVREKAALIWQGRVMMEKK